MKSAKILGRRGLPVLGLVLAPAVALAVPASAATTDVTYDCEADTFIGPVNTTMDSSIDVTAPSSVAAGGDLTVTLDPAPGTAPSEVGPASLDTIEDLTLRATAPSNATITDMSLSGGSGVGDTSVTQQGDQILLHATGPIEGGAQYELPTITVEGTAGSSGQIQSSLAGTSYDDPGLTVTGTGSIFGISVTTDASCYPNPDPGPLFTTTIQ